jgi:ribosomal-protein-alanine N-acetyltransferase
VTIRTLESRDIDSVVAIQSACPEIAQWTMWDYDRVARGEMSGWVWGEAAASKEIAGFLVARRIANDLEILNFAVRFELRRCGVGALLLGAALEWGKSFRAETAILEVRESNLAALRFYERHGFQVMGRRPRYYTAPVEDALLLIAPLAGAIPNV